MAKSLISIQDAADLSKKSIQTIRRAIKAKKLKCKKKKTPQGFNYLIDHESLCTLYKISAPKKEVNIKAPKLKAASKKISIKKPKEITISTGDFKSLTVALDKLVKQHSSERQNFLRLINTLQERLFVLENQLNLLKEPVSGDKRWYQFWR